MAMELTILGSGSAFDRTRHPAGYALRLEPGRTLLFDLGFGNLRQLWRAGLDAASVTDVFCSHRHPDHVGDLAALLFALRYDVKPRSGRLRLWGPPGFSSFIKRLRAAHAPWLGPRGYRLEVRELRAGAPVLKDGWALETLAVPHETTALALRLSYKGKSVVYSGDTGFCAELPDFAAEADLFLLECTTTERDRAASKRYDGHLTPRQALAILGASRCKRGVLTHLSSATRALLAQKRLPRNVLVADDLLRVSAS